MSRQFNDPMAKWPDSLTPSAREASIPAGHAFAFKGRTHRKKRALLSVSQGIALDATARVW
jgi:hypothetical protein